MSWRKIKREDLVRGTVIRLNRLMEDGAYCMATIIKSYNSPVDVDDSEKRVLVARPYAYAHEHFDARSPLLGSEVLEYTFERILNESSEVEVFQGKDEIRKMTT